MPFWYLSPGPDLNVGAKLTEGDVPAQGRYEISLGREGWARTCTILIAPATSHAALENIGRDRPHRPRRNQIPPSASRRYPCGRLPTHRARPPVASQRRYRHAAAPGR
jgi:hypothetical protein